MSSFLDLDVGDAQEPKVMPANEEYELKIIDARTDVDKNGDPYLMPRFEISGEPLAKDFTHFIRLPHEGMDEKELNRAKWNLKLFLQCFSLPESGQLDVNDIAGARGWGILGIKDDETYGEQNTIKKFIAPRQ